MARLSRPARRARAAQVVLAGALVLSPVTAAAAPAAPAVASAAACIPVTGLLMPADPQGLDQVLNGAAVLGPCDAWAVGATGGSTVANRTLTEHYDGSGWTIVPSPSPAQGGDDNVLTAVAAVSPANVWAVGSISGAQTLIEHWDGIRWTVVPSANPGSAITASQLAGVVALTPSNAWAVGSTTSGNSQALIEHWNGRAWTQATIPAIGTSSRLNGVAASSDRNIWAAGSYGDSNGSHPLAEQFDGNNWNVIPSPDGGQANELFGPGTSSATSTWLVGVADGHPLAINCC